MFAAESVRCCWHVLALCGVPFVAGCSLDVLQSGLDGTGGAGGGGVNRCAPAVAAMAPVLGQTKADDWVPMVADEKYASVFKVPAAGAVTSVCAWLQGRGGVGQELRGAVYDETGSSLRMQTDALTVGGDVAAAWFELPLRSEVEVDGTESLRIGLHAGPGDALEVGSNQLGSRLEVHDTYADDVSAVFDAEGVPDTFDGSLVVFGLYD